MAEGTKYRTALCAIRAAGGISGRVTTLKPCSNGTSGVSMYPRAGWYHGMSKLDGLRTVNRQRGRHALPGTRRRSLQVDRS